MTRKIKIIVDYKAFEQKFLTSLAGVTKENEDGSCRQEILKRCKVGQPVKLIREPKNPYDKYAVAVYNLFGQQLGYIPKGDWRLADHIDMGGHVTARIKEITGGTGFLGLFFKSMRKHYGCVIEITKGDFNWKKVTPYMDKNKEIVKLLENARKMEASSRPQAIKMYREAISQINKLDNMGTVATAWRYAKYPINRLSLLLEKEGDYQSAYDEISKYEKYEDANGLTAKGKKSVESRKDRLKRKLGINEDK